MKACIGKALSLFALFLLIAGTLPAAPAPGPPGGGSGPPCWPPPCIPIDGGVGFLIIAGLVFGAWKLFVSYKRKTV